MFSEISPSALFNHKPSAKFKTQDPGLHPNKFQMERFKHKIKLDSSIREKKKNLIIMEWEGRNRTHKQNKKKKTDYIKN